MTEAMTELDEVMVLTLAKAISGHGHRWNEILPSAREMWIRSAKRGLTAILPDLREQHHAEERRRVVAWLRTAPNPWGSGPANWLADRIERGDHITKEGE